MMKLIKGFSSLLYIDPMDGGDIGDSSGALGTGWHCPWGLDGLEEAWERPEVLSPSPLSNLLLDCDDFFLHWVLLRVTSTGRPPWKPGGSCPQSTPPASRLTYSTHSHNTLRSLASLRGTFLRVCLLVWPLMQFLLSSLFNNQQSG